jgi:hypothetical protein
VTVTKNVEFDMAKSSVRTKFTSPAAARPAGPIVIKVGKALPKASAKGEVVDAEVVVSKTEETGPNQASESRNVTVSAKQEVRSTSVTTDSCVRALEKSIGFTKGALYLEVGVALAVFASSSTGADLATKRRVMDIYSQAGFEVENRGKDYKTVHRRMTASADLFNMLGRETVLAAMDGLRDGKAIDRLCLHLGTEYKFDSINSLLEFVGKPVAQTNTPEVRAARAAKELAELNNATHSLSVGERMEARMAERQQQLAEESDGIIVSAGKLSLVVPRDITPDEVMAMVAKLTDFADRLKAEIGTPEDQRNREMHS